MGVGKLTKRLGCLRMLLFPAFATTASRLSAQTDDPGSSLCLSARPSATVWRPQPQTASASRGLPPQYFHVISASKARRWGPVILEAARRRSAICDGLSDGRLCNVACGMHMILKCGSNEAKEPL